MGSMADASAVIVEDTGGVSASAAWAMGCHGAEGSEAYWRAHRRGADENVVFMLKGACAQRRLLLAGRGCATHAVRRAGCASAPGTMAAAQP